jgi:hypothetical protein
LPGEFTIGNLMSRALGGEGLREFRQRIEETARGTTKKEQISAKVVKGLAPFLAPIIGPVGYMLARGASTDLKAGGYSRLKESAEFKKLSTLMDDQKQISVTSSKTLSKLFFGYTAFNTIAKRASQREQKSYEIQIDQLKQQRSGIVVKYKAGEIDKGDLKSQVQEVNKEIIALTRKAKEAAATSKDRATREAVGLVAGAGTTFARALGVSEAALEGLGGSAAAAIIAWNAWTGLTGEEMPEVVKKATEKAKEWGDTLGEKGVTWLDKLEMWIATHHPIGKYAPEMFGKAGQAAAAAKAAEEATTAQKGMFTEQEKEKIKRLKDFEATDENVKQTDELLNSFKSGDIKKLSKDDQIIKINDDQLSTLLAIEENTKQTSEGSEEIKPEDKKPESKQDEIVRELRSKLDVIKQESLSRGGDVATKLKDFLAGAMLIASGSYLAEKGTLSAELGEATRRAEKINSSFEALVNKFPKEVEALIQEMQVRRAEMIEASKAGGPETTEKSLLLDTAKLYDEFLNELLALAEKTESNVVKSGEIIGAAIDKMHLRQAGAEIATAIEDFAKSIIEASIDLETGLRLRTETVGAMKGMPAFEEISMGKMPHELTATERLMKSGGPAWQNMYKTFKTLDNVRENLIGLVQTQAKSIVGTQYNLWAETSEQQQILKSQRGNVETYNKTVDPRLITKEIKSKKSELDKFKSSSKQLVEQYRQALKEGKLDKITNWLIKSTPAGKDVARAFGPSEKDVIGASLGESNKNVIRVKQQIQSLQGLSAELGNTKLGKAASSLRIKITETMEKLRMQVDVYGDLEAATKTITELMEQLHSVLATGLNIQQLIGDFEQMKASFTLEELQQQFIEAAGTFEQLRRGGAAPGAPVWPTFEMMQAGMTEDQMNQATRRDAALASIVAQGRMPTGEDLQRIAFEDRLRKRQYAQAEEDDKLNRQQSAAAELHRRILEAQRRVGLIEGEDNEEMRGALINNFEKIRTDLVKRAAYAGERREEVSPGVWERYGYDFDAIGEALKAIGEQYGPEGEDLVKEIGDISKIMDQMGLGTYSPIVKELSQANTYLKDIVNNTAKSPGIIESLKDLFNPVESPGKKPSGAGGEFQTGGIITGAGGPKDDRVPIMASPGEFVVRASSAKRLGSSALTYMNSTGNIPGFAEGGEVPEWARKYPNLYGLFGAGKAAGTAVGTAVTDIAHGVTDPFVDLYKGQGNYVANLLYASMAAFPEAKGAMMGLGQVIKGPLGQKATRQLAEQSAKYLKTVFKSKPAKKSITKATSTGKYMDEITQQVMETKYAQTNLGYALGIRAAEQDVKILASMAKLRKRLRVGYDDAMKADDFETASILGTKMQGMREGRELAEGILALKAGRTPPINSATPKAIKYMETGTLDNLPKLDFPSTSKLMGKLSEETGLGPPGGVLQMIGESAAALFKKQDVNPADIKALIATTRKEYPQISKKLVNITASPESRLGGLRGRFTGYGSESPFYDIELSSELFKGTRKGVEQTWHHEFGHAIDAYVEDAAKFFKSRKLPLPKNLEAMQGFVAKQKTGLFGEPVIEKMADLFMLSKEGSKKTIVKKYSDIFSKEKLGEDLSKYVPSELMDKWNISMRKSIAKKAEGGWIGTLKEMWTSFAGEASGEGDTVSAPEVARRIKERGQKQRDIIKDLFADKKDINSYSKGTPYVPQTQLAVVDQGEAIIPAKYNMGGFIGASKFVAGGAVNPLKAAENAGEAIGEIIAKKMEEADITLNVPDSSDLPTLEIGNLDELKTVLDGASVGADRTSKLDQFIEVANNKLDRLEELTVVNTERITIVEAQASDIVEIDSIKLNISSIENKLSDVYTVMENKVDSDRDNSYMESRLHEIVSDLKTDDILPIRSNVNRLDLLVNDMVRDISEQYDIIYSNINRLDLR